MKKIFVIFGALILLTIATTFSSSYTSTKTAIYTNDSDQVQTLANKIYPGA